MKPLTQEQFEAIRQFLFKHQDFDALTINSFDLSFQPQPEQPTLIPFDLTVALANPERVVYRDGSKPLEWHWFEKVSGLYPITSVATNELCVIHTKDGNQVDDENNTPKDLFLLPEAKKEYCIDIFQSLKDNHIWQGKIRCSTEEICFDVKQHKYIKTISFTI